MKTQKFSNASAIDLQKKETARASMGKMVKHLLKKNGVHLISVMEPIAEGSQGILVETLLEGMAEYYSAELSEKVIRGQTENALKGNVPAERERSAIKSTRTSFIILTR